jgi:hypothetical protein
MYFGFGFKGLFFCRNNGWIMKNMDKGLTVPKCLLINWRKIPQNALNFICPNCLPKPERLGIRWKKASLGVRSPCSLILLLSCFHFHNFFLFCVYWWWPRTAHNGLKSRKWYFFFSKFVVRKNHSRDRRDLVKIRDWRPSICKKI